MQLDRNKTACKCLLEHSVERFAWKTSREARERRRRDSMMHTIISCLFLLVLCFASITVQGTCSRCHGIGIRLYLVATHGSSLKLFSWTAGVLQVSSSYPRDSIGHEGLDPQHLEQQYTFGYQPEIGVVGQNSTTSFRLLYFAARGRAETARLILEFG